MPTKPSPEALDAMATLFSETLFDIMVGITQADTVEAEYAKIQEEARKLTTQEMHRIADEAAKYVVEHANPSPGEVPKHDWPALKKKALEFALKTNGKKTQT